MRHLLALLVVMASLIGGALVPATASAAPLQQTIQIDNAFKGYWERNGGLARFGYPITEARMETNSSGDTVLTQWFERTRLEHHPNNPAPYKILQGRIGAERLAQLGRQPQDGHAIAEVFRNYWNRNGGLAGFGHPISAAVEETNSSGDRVLTQWFERARFEWHTDPCNRCGGIVLLGRLGAECYEGRTPPAPPAPAPSPNCYALSGQVYEAYVGSNKNNAYNARWECDGRLWQPWLPPGDQRQEHTVGITIEEGNYVFNGVECALKLDPSRNGRGGDNPVTVGYGNGQQFSVNTADGGQAWALVECRGNYSSGFEIKWLR